MLTAEDQETIRRIVREEVAGLATAVVQKLRHTEEIRLDEEYEASLPMEEQKRIARERMRLDDQEEKGASEI